MTQIALGIAPPTHDKDNDKCPFCVSVSDSYPYKTYKGDTNSSSKLRSCMKNPSNLTKLQPGALPKDDKDNHQNQDDIRFFTKAKAKSLGVSPSAPIYQDTSQPRVKQDYSDEAHHALSGNQILNEHRIEQFTSKSAEDSKLKGDTGYSVNNCANGVCLPSYPTYYRKKSTPEKWGDLSQEVQTQIMEKPMAAGKGQVHIGGHAITPLTADIVDEDMDDYDDGSTNSLHGRNDTGRSYPDHAHDLLDDLYDKISNWAAGCPFCEKDKDEDAYPPPYPINQALDNISGRLIKHVQNTPPIKWKYFLSEYAKNYTIKLREE